MKIKTQSNNNQNKESIIDLIAPQDATDIDLEPKKLSNTLHKPEELELD